MSMPWPRCSISFFVELWQVLHRLCSSPSANLSYGDQTSMGEASLPDGASQGILCGQVAHPRAGHSDGMR
jgi:hypothetical protein